MTNQWKFPNVIFERSWTRLGLRRVWGLLGNTSWSTASVSTGDCTSFVEHCPHWRTLCKDLRTKMVAVAWALGKILSKMMASHVLQKKTLGALVMNIQRHKISLKTWTQLKLKKRFLDTVNILSRYILRVWDTPPRLVRHIFNSSSVAFKRKSAVLRLPMCTRWMLQVANISIKWPDQATASLGS